MKLLGIGDNVFDHYRWRKELYPGGNSVNVPVLARRYDGSEAGYIGLIADDREGRHFLKALDEEGLDVSRVRMMHGVTARNYIEIDEQGDRHFVGNNGRETAQYQSMLMLTPVDYAMMEQYDLVHTSIHSWLDMYHVAMSRWAPLSMDFSGEYTRINMGQLCPLLRFAFFSGGSPYPGQGCGGQWRQDCRGHHGYAWLLPAGEGPGASTGSPRRAGGGRPGCRRFLHRGVPGQVSCQRRRSG